jgi:hypothetical protein
MHASIVHMYFPLSSLGEECFSNYGPYCKLATMTRCSVTYLLTKQKFKLVQLVKKCSTMTRLSIKKNKK